MASQAWHDLGGQRPTDLSEERQQLHWASQALSAVADAAIDRLPDDSHSNLGWDHTSAAFVTQPFSGGHMAALTLAELTLEWRAPDGTTLSTFALDGQSLQAARAWLTEQVRPTVKGLADGPVPARDYDMPAHPIADGQPFTGGARERRIELAHWFATADIALNEAAENNPGSSAVRTWPHHFDTGLLISLEPGADPEDARSIGLGFSPGDEGMPQPYYYVNPYPRPEPASLPALPSGGRWEQELFFGALLTGEALVDGGPRPEQHARTRVFLASAIDASAKLLGL